MHLNKGFVFLLMLFMVLCFSVSALAEGLPMNNHSFGAKPKNENYISSSEYVDSSITVKFYEDQEGYTPYFYAHVKISHPSQFRTAPAGIVDNKNSTFRTTTTFAGIAIARTVNAVVAMNGDYHASNAHCHVVLRNGVQSRNQAQITDEMLLVDMNGDFHTLTGMNKADYKAYYEANKDNMYQILCFGPILCQDGVKVLSDDYRNNSIGSVKQAQRSAIAQIGPLEYLLITCEGPQTHPKAGMTVPEFAALCEKIGKRFSEKGCLVAYNLDGGNSATIIFKGINQDNKFGYIKYNFPEVNRYLSDIVYFATLEK